MKAMSARVGLALVLALIVSGTARAELIFGSGIVSSFEGTFHYTADSSSSATISVSLTNTTSIPFGDLTGFAFNNPNNSITGVTFSSTDPDFGLLGGSSFNNTITAFPFGRFDLGASTGSSIFGDAGQGLAPGESGTFTFLLTGNNLDQLTAATFFETPSAATRFHFLQAEFITTYRYLVILPDIAPGEAQSDPPPQLPEPSAVVLAGIGAGLFGFSAWRRYRRGIPPQA